MSPKKPLVAAAITVVLCLPTSAALASSGDSAAVDSTNTSTTVPARRDGAKAPGFRSEIQVWQEATRAWLAGRNSAMRTHREAIAAASATLKDTLASATTKQERKAAMDAFAASRKSAKAALDSALANLGSRPERPRR